MDYPRTAAEFMEWRRLDRAELHDMVTAAIRRKAANRNKSLQMAADWTAMHPSPSPIILRPPSATVQSSPLATPSSETVQPPCPFFELPPEIRLLIYEFAFAEGGVIKVNFDRSAPMSGNALQCAFDPIIGVSKEWFKEALQVFLQSRQFQFEIVDSRIQIDRLPLYIRQNIFSLSWRQGSVYNWPLEFCCYRSGSPGEILPNIKALQVFIGHGEFFTHGHHTTHELTLPRWEEALGWMRCLKSFDAVIQSFDEFAENCSWTSARSEYDTNVEHFQKEVRSAFNRATGASCDEIAPLRV